MDTAAVEIGMVTDKYVQAAVRALGEYTGRRIRVGGAGTLSWQPEWDAAAWDGRLPVVLGRMIFGDSVSSADRRVLDPEQIAPVWMNGGEVKTAADGLDLRPTLWVLLFGLFLLERIIVFRNGKT